MNAVVEQVANPFAVSTPAGGHVAEGAGGRAMQARENTEVMAMVMMAKRFPRNVIQAADKIRNAFTRQTLAEKAQYQFGRGGSDVVGPSIRAAEAMSQQWGNMSSGWRELSRYVGPDGVGMSEVEAYCVDYETNNRESIQFVVRHWRDTKNGGYKLRDERDIYELCANQAARRKRACILAQIPGDVTEMAMEQASATLKAKADVTPEGIKKMLETFLTEFGVTKEQIEKRIQRRVDSIQPAQVVGLKRIYVSLRDEMSTVNDWFEPVEAAPGAPAAPASPANSAERAKEALKRTKAAATPAPAPAPTQPAAEATGDQQDMLSDAPVFDAAKLEQQMQDAADKGDRDTLDALGDSIGGVEDAKARKKLADKYHALVAQLDQQ
jgi:hypothetical protein